MAKNFTIVLEGGIVQAVVTADPEMIGVGFDIVDYDIEGMDDEFVTNVGQKDGSVARAYIGGGYIEPSHITILEKEDDETHASSRVG